MAKRIDLGCGKNRADGCDTGVDIWHGNEPDIVADIRYRIQQLPDGCAEFVICRHVLEHLGVNEAHLVLREIARLLEPGGRFEIRVPHPAYEDAMIHGHIHVLTPRFWRDGRDGGWFPGLEILEIEETPNPACEAFCREYDFPFTPWASFLRNAYVETVVRGVRP